MRLASEGHHVVVGARREDRLAELADKIRADGGGVDVCRLDVTDRADVAAFVDGAVDRHGRVDVLVSNAGVMPLSPLDSLLVDEWDRMIDVNVRGLLHGIAATLPHFQRAGGGHFVTVASIAAHGVVPTAAVYCATKYAAWAVTEGLRQEVDPSGHPAGSHRRGHLVRVGATVRCGRQRDRRPAGASAVTVHP